MIDASHFQEDTFKSTANMLMLAQRGAAEKTEVLDRELQDSRTQNQNPDLLPAQVHYSPILHCHGWTVWTEVGRGHDPEEHHC